MGCPGAKSLNLPQYRRLHSKDRLFSRYSSRWGDLTQIFRLDESMGREVQLESEMVQEKRARLDEKNSMVEKLTKAEKQLEQEKTKAMQSSREMEDIKESMKTQQLINMEMKDYERAVNELKNQLELKTNELNSAVQGKNFN